MNALKFFKCCSCACCLLSFGCEPAQKIQPIEMANASWSPVVDEKIVLVRMHPGMAQKNSYITWQLYENTQTHLKKWRMDDNDVSVEAVKYLEKLRDMPESESWILSDGIYGCRATETSPQYRVDIDHAGKHYRMISVSDCLHVAPFNMIRDGQYYTQLDGSFGDILSKVLLESKSELHVMGTAGMIMLEKPLVIDGYQAGSGKPIYEYYHSLLMKSSAFSSVFNAFLKHFKNFEPPKIACNQSASTDCKNFSAQYRYKMNDAVYTLPIQYTEGSVLYVNDIPDDASLERLNRLLTGNLYSLYRMQNPDNEVRVSWKREGKCSMIRGLAKWFDKDGASIVCSVYQLSGDGRPNAIYYEGLDALWISYDEVSRPFYDAYCRERKGALGLCKVLGQKKSPIFDSAPQIFLPLQMKQPVRAIGKKGSNTILKQF